MRRDSGSAAALSRARREAKKFIRSAVASAIGFGVDASILLALKGLAHFHYLVANAFSFTIGTVVVYFFSRFWVFETGRLKNRRVGFIVFLGLSAVGLVLNTALLALCVEVLKFPLLASKVACACLVFLYNYACRRFIVFPERGAAGAPR